jgi:ABC-type lipoprotein export system ATPase subunit
LIGLQGLLGRNGAVSAWGASPLRMHPSKSQLLKENRVIPITMNTTTALLDLSGVTKTYPSIDGKEGTVVLKGINLTLYAGESLAIVGPSGSGKSTLLNIIGTLDRPSSGMVSFQGKGLALLKETDLDLIRNQQIGFVFQAHHLLPQCTVLENVLVPTLAFPQSGTESRERALALLTRVGLEHRLNYRPGLLSGGEKQRVAVVRALINQPKLILADEPTGSLDRAHAQELFDLLLEMNREQGIALIVVTHSESLAQRLQQVMVLTDGRLSKLN